MLFISCTQSTILAAWFMEISRGILYRNVLLAIFFFNTYTSSVNIGKTCSYKIKLKIFSMKKLHRVQGATMPQLLTAMYDLRKPKERGSRLSTARSYLESASNYYLLPRKVLHS